VWGRRPGRDEVTRAGIDRLLAALGSLPRDVGETGWVARVEWLRGTVAWLAGDGDSARLEACAARLRADPGAASLFREAVQVVFEGGQGLRLLADGGFPQRASLLEEALARLVRSVVPPVPESRDLMDVVARVLLRPDEARWLASLPAGTLAAFLEAAGLTDPALWPALRRCLAEAVRVHGLRCANIGFDGDFRRALGRPDVAGSPFLRLDAATASLLDAAAGPGKDPARAAEARAAIEACVAEARAARRVVLEQLESTGVSTGLIHRLDLLAKGLARIAGALPLLAPRPGERPAAAGEALVRSLVADLRHDASLVNVFRDRSRLLAKKIAERAGAAGARYITVDRAEWWRMLAKGAGGGLLMVLAVFVKAVVYEAHPPPGTAALLMFLDYALAFLAIYTLHWTLATKQPPMTAAALADALSVAEERRDLRPLQDLVARIGRSQVAGLLGNVAVAGIGAWLLDLAFRSRTGAPVLAEEAAVHGLESHDPFASATLLYAVYTGVAVWLSSMVAGWVENAADYGRLRESLNARGPRGVRVRGGRLTAWVVNNVGGVAGNVSLAFFLVALTFTGKVFGIPVDVRHVTLATGQVGLSCSALGEFFSPAVGWALLGLLLIGFLNIATGFLLSLAVAMRSRGIPLRARLSVLGSVVFARPRNWMQYFLPVGDLTVDAAPGSAPAPAAPAAPALPAGPPQGHR